MSEKPTPAPWEIAPEGTYPPGEGHKILGPWRKTKAGHPVRHYVAQFMTKADAELIVRAQHMDELVEAIQPFMVTMRQLEAKFLDTRSGRQEIVLDAQTVTHPIKDDQYIVSGFRHTYFVSEEIALQMFHFRKVAAILSKIEGKQ